jgi:DNA-binding sugar fermentation-stimulating protein
MHVHNLLQMKEISHKTKFILYYQKQNPTKNLTFKLTQIMQRKVNLKTKLSKQFKTKTLQLSFSRNSLHQLSEIK